MKKRAIMLVAVLGFALLAVAGWEHLSGIGETDFRPDRGESMGSREAATESPGGQAHSRIPGGEVDTQLEALAQVFPASNEPVRHVEVQRANGDRFVADLAGAGKIPESFPEELPIFPGATSAGVLSVGGEGLAGAFVAEAPLPEVYGFYRDMLIEEGWTILGDDRDTTRDLDDRLTASKGNRQVWVTITEVGGTSQIFMAMQEG